MAGWPTEGELEQWLSSQSLSTKTYADRLPFAFDAALEVVQDDVRFTLFPTYNALTAATVFDVDDNPTGYAVPHRVRMAVLILAHKLVTRADSPSGVIGFADFAVRISNEDPDYAKLVQRYTLPGIA